MLKNETIKHYVSVLQRNFNRKFSEEQFARIVDVIKYLDERELKIIVNHFIDKHRHLPLPGDFKDAFIKLGISVDTSLKVSVKLPKNECRMCKGEGLVSAENKHRIEAPYAFKCPNGCAKDLSNAIPMWNYGFAKNYKLMIQG